MVLSVTLSAQPSSTDNVVIRDAPRPYVIVDRPGQEPIVVKGSDEILARSDLVGIWEVSYLEQQAEPRPELAAQLHLRFSRGKIELFQAGCAPKVVAYNLDVKDYPRQFDWYEYRGSSLRLQRGVYWIEGDTLLLCMGAVNSRRATEFLTTPYDGRTLFVLKRVDDKNEVPPQVPQ
jgi:uncharacterized protein (TIGR03067 family)